MPSKIRVLLVCLLLWRASPCAAAVSFIQAHSAIASFATTVSVTITSSGSGSLIVVATSRAVAGAAPTVSDNQSNTYTGPTTKADSGNINNLHFYYKVNATAGVTSITLTFDASGNWTIVVGEFGGVATTNALDGTIQTGSGVSFANPAVWSVPSITTTGTSDLLVNPVEEGEANSTPTWAASGSWVKAASADSALAVYIGYQLNVAANTYSASGTYSPGGGNDFASAVAAFLVAGAGGGCTPTFPLLGVGRCG